jgi:hypothetical protein
VVGLGAAGKYGRFRRSTVTGQGDGQGAHGGAVAGVVFGGGRFRVAGLAELDQVAAHRVTDIDRLGAHPGVESRGGGLGLDAAAGKDGFAERQRHRRVVGDPPGFQAQPAAAGDFAVHAVLVADFVGRQELDRGAQRITDGKPEVGGDPAANVRCLPGRRDRPAAYRGIAGDQVSGPKHLA